MKNPEPKTYATKPPKGEIDDIWLEPVAGFDPWRLPGDAVFHPDLADRACKWFSKHLVHIKGKLAGKPFELDRWQKQVVGHLFGWLKPDGKRRFDTLWIYVPRKNGKTTFAAGLMVMLLFTDKEPGAELYTAASDTKQAHISFFLADKMIEKNDNLSKRIRSYKSFKTIEYNEYDAVFNVLSGESKNKDGLNPSAFLVDEVHAQDSPELMDLLETGTGTREQPLGIYITTADYSRPSPCNEKLAEAKGVRDGTIPDPGYFPVVYEALRTDDWESEETWKRVNPGYGTSLRPEYIKKHYRRAKRTPSYENIFKRLFLNIQTEQLTRWIQMHKWNLCTGAKLTVDDLKGKNCSGGLDLSSTTDITAFDLYFPEYHALLAWFWVPQSILIDRIEYETWVNQGYIEAIPGEVIDYAYPQKKILELDKVYDIQEIGYDPWNSSQCVVELADKHGIKMVAFKQGYEYFNPPCKEFEKQIIQTILNHFNNPVLNWMASNVMVIEKGDSVRPVKPSRGSKQKIDGIAAAIMALGCSMFPSEKPKESIYKKRGIIVL